MKEEMNICPNCKGIGEINEERTLMDSIYGERIYECEYCQEIGKITYKKLAQYWEMEAKRLKGLFIQVDEWHNEDREKILKLNDKIKELKKQIKDPK